MAKSGTTPEVRLSLLITALLAVVTLAGRTYGVRKASDGIRGIGFFLNSVNRGCGLTGIWDRVTVLGGTCKIGTEPGCGTRIVVVLPMRDPERSA